MLPSMLGRSKVLPYAGTNVGAFEMPLVGAGMSGALRTLVPVGSEESGNGTGPQAPAATRSDEDPILLPNRS